ncbi:MAG: GAF domain-containing protein, partial [Chloroflexota bacterium]
LQDIAIINEAARIIVDADDQTSMMEDVLALIASAIGATSAVFTEFNYIRSDWSTFATYNVSEDTTPNVRRPAEDYPHGVEALQTNSVVVVEDVTEYEGFPEYIIEQYDVRAVAAMPLVGRGESLGVAFFNYVHDAHAFDESPVSLLEGISRQIATGVEAKRAEESNRRRLVEIQVANAAARIVTEAPDVKTMLSEILELLAEGLGADNAALVNYVQDENRWEGIVGYGMPAGIIENVNDPYESFPHAVDALETNEPVAVDNAYEYEKFPMDYVESIGIKSVLAVPIANRRDKIGVAFFNFNNDFHAFRDDEIRLAKTVAQQIVSGIAQKQSEETNARLRRLSDSSNDFMGTADLETLAITYINGAGLNLIGYTEEDIYGKPIPMLHTEAAFKKVSEEGVPVVMSGEAWRSESELVAKDGTVIPVEQTMFVVTDSDGNPISLGTTMTDIRSRKQAESNMRRFAMLTDNSTDFIGYADLHTQQALYVNEAGARLLGYAPEETIGIPLTDLATPETTELFQTAIPEVMATGNWFGQTTLQHKDGTAIPVEQQIYLLTDDDGKPFALATTARDIRDRIEQEEIVRQRAAQLETVSEVATQAANTLDLDDMLQDVVDLAKKQFDLYHAHIYLLDGSELILAAGADENGRRMKATGHHISINNQNSIVATAARSGAPVRSNDVTSNIAFLPNPLLPKTRSELAVPLIYNREVIGVFDIQDDKPNRFRAEDETIQEILAGQIAVAVQNSRTFAKEQERARELETVAQVSTASSTILDTDVLLKQVVELTKEAFDLYHAHIYLLNPEGDRLFVAAGSGSAGDLMQANNHNIAMQHETS